MKTFGEYVTSGPFPSSRSARASAQSSSRGRSWSSIEGAYVSTTGLHEIAGREAEQDREGQDGRPRSHELDVASARPRSRDDRSAGEPEGESDQTLDRLESDPGRKREAEPYPGAVQRQRSRAGSCSEIAGRDRHHAREPESHEQHERSRCGRAESQCERDRDGTGEPGRDRCAHPATDTKRLTP